MLREEDKLEDNFKDDISNAISEFLKITTWTEEKRKSYTNMLKIIENEGYINFQGSYKVYHLTKTGDSCLYDVPENQRGVLKIFSGKRIRLICVGSGKYVLRKFYVKQI